jgi:hypothetical protein
MATPLPRHPEHREIAAASCPLPGSGQGIVTIQGGILKGPEPNSPLQHEKLADVRYGSVADILSL